MITNVDDTVDVIFSPLASLACEATVIAIGGGGYNYGHGYGGGGSGYVESNIIDIFSTEYEVSVGDWRQDSFVREKNGQWAWGEVLSCFSVENIFISFTI